MMPRMRGFGGRRRASVWLLLLAIAWAGAAAAQGGPLEVRRVSPSGTDVQPGQEAVIQFDRAMVPLGHMGRKTSELPVSIKPDPGCQWRWLNTSELACRLAKQVRFAPATEYTITVGTALKALDGSHLDEPDVETFTTWLPKVDRSEFQTWRSPTTPVFMVRLNMPVTAAQLARHIGFVGPDGEWVAAKVEPFTKDREGPLFLPMPGHPGAVIAIDKPMPDKPLDSHASAAAGRRVWQVVPVHHLAAATKYRLHVRPGMRSPLGARPGDQDEDIDGMSTYGAFTLRAVTCNADTVVQPGDTDSTPCEPASVGLRFSVPVPRATLAAVEWTPLPLPKAKLAASWRDYPEWWLRAPDNAFDADNGDGYPLYFVLDPMRAWKITLPAGVEDAFGRRLAKPVTISFRTGHRSPFLDVPPGEAVLETNQQTIVPLRFTNLDSFQFNWRRLGPNDLFPGIEPASPEPAPSPSSRPYQPWRGTIPGPFTETSTADSVLQRGDGSFGSEDLLARPDLAAVEDKIVKGALGIRELLKGAAGVVWGTLDWSPNGPYNPYKFMGEVTPWQVLAKVGHYGTLVWVNRWDSGQPVAGARVKLLLGDHRSLGSLAPLGDATRTGADGLAQLQGTAKFPQAWFKQWDNESNFYVGTALGADMALLPLDGTFQRSVGDASNYAFWSDTAPPNGHLRAWAVTEQGIYRPGSDVKYAAFVRAEGATKLEAPPALDYTLTITDPEGNEVQKREGLKLSPFGGVDGSLHVGKTAPMGWYAINISWPTENGTASRQAGRFMVTDFVPATFKVHTEVLGTHFEPGDAVKVRVGATLHAGGPYTDAKVKFTTQLVPKVFAPDTPVASQFSFYDGSETTPTTQTLAVTDGVLDQAGYAHAELTLPTTTDVVFGEVQVEGSVESARSTWVANDASVPFSSRDRFVGLRVKDWVQTATKPFAVQYLVVDPAGNPAAGAKVAVQLQRRVITRVRVKDGSGNYSEEEHAKWSSVGHCEAVSTNAPGSCELTPPQAGDYRVLATVTDTRGRSESSTLGTWVTGEGEVVWSTAGKGVSMVPDKSSYHVGDTAHVLVQNPYPGAEALVTIERYGVLWKKVVTLKGSAPVIDVPIGPECFPGAYLSVAIFSPRVAPPADPDLGRPEVAIGYQVLKVTGKGSSLDIQVKPAKAGYKPRQAGDGGVAVGPHDGKAPGKTRLVVAVVDQGVVDLLTAGSKYYDPRETFYAPPNGPDVVNYSLANQLLTMLQPKAGKGENPGGGGGESAGPNVRSQFAYAAYWNPDLETSRSGRAHFSFKVPDNLTRWRILVVAMTPGDAMGLGDGSVRVNLPLQVEPALPNQMRVGDHFGAAFNVTNRTTGPLHVSTHIEANGAIVGGSAKSDGMLDLASFAHGLSWLDLKAGQPGYITLTATATAGKLGDAVEAHIPVKPAGTEVVAAEYGSTTTAGAEVPVKVPPKAMPGSAQVTVRFAPTMVGGLDGAFAVMRDDPLQMWETRLSRGVLASDYLRLKPVLGKSFDWQDAPHTIDWMLGSAADFQAPNGGMSFWIPSNRFVSNYLSVYTALAFDWLDDAGHAPPEAVRQKLWTFLHTEILARSGDHPAAPVLRAGAMAALAMSKDGNLPDGAVAGMLPKLHKLRLFGQALLLDAAIASHDRKSADAIAKSLLSYAEESAGEISFNEREGDAYLDILATPLRSNCAILDALSRYHTAYGDENLLGTVPQKAMRWVSGQRRNAGGWPNSQENVFCTTATTHYADAYEVPVKSLVGSLQLPGQPAQSAHFASRATPAVKLAGPAAAPGQQFEVQLGRSGEGRLYYGVQVRYMMPPGFLPAADAGMTLSREYHVLRDNKWVAVKPGVVLKRGEIVRVDLVVDAPTERHHVVLTDPLPGAFEAVNRLLATSAKVTPAAQPGVAVLMFDGGPWPNMSIVEGGFYHRETHFDAVRFFADDLPAGHYRVVYSAQVIAPGSFTAPAPTVKEIYQPDVFGRGVDTHVDVAMPGH